MIVRGGLSNYTDTVQAHLVLNMVVENVTVLAMLKQLRYKQLVMFVVMDIQICAISELE